MKIDRYPILPDLKYIHGTTLLHQLHPLAKLVMLVCFSVSVFLVNHWIGGLLLLALLLIGYQMAELGLSYFTRKLRFILIFCVMILLVQIAFTKEGHVLFTITLGIIHIQVWSGAVDNGLQLALRFLNIIASSFLFVSTTQPKLLSYSLMQVGVPYRYGFMLITALRFIPTFHHEFQQIKNAQLARGISFKGVSIKTLVRMVQYLFIPMIVSSLSKVQTLSISMEGRAFGMYKQRTFSQTVEASLVDWLVIGGSVIIIITIWIII
ncbi:energy-coupling factor transporter transmembrane component T family protein [Desulfuribacillus alkaliarsenatis]|uniref:Cobalt transporter n=1 Tax=Desulfuribacillus alkaliarsenatis TaxID=766136 RepID=A0A1E5FZB1_9FIRM|nr:energy-coupling factor transporter transmembrane component T [Desulfuribacillus alkaliarsenatis]OEF95916.1 hypothetical protein BHF68_11030 [Desulfuribacillus alkaliarsenatis]